MRSDLQGVTFCWLKMGNLKTIKQYFKRYYLIFVLQFWKKKIETLRYVKKNSFEYSVRDVRITGTTKYSVSFSSLSLSFRFSLQEIRLQIPSQYNLPLSWTPLSLPQKEDQLHGTLNSYCSFLSWRNQSMFFRRRINIS